METSISAELRSAKASELLKMVGSDICLSVYKSNLLIRPHSIPNTLKATKVKKSEIIQENGNQKMVIIILLWKF
jgi:hypothetical protein